MVIVVAAGGRGDTEGHGAAPALPSLASLLARGPHAELLAHEGVGEDGAVLEGVRLACLDHPLPACHLYNKVMTRQNRLKETFGF